MAIATKLELVSKINKVRAKYAKDSFYSQSNYMVYGNNSIPEIVNSLKTKTTNIHYLTKY